MAGTSLLALIDDIASVLDDVALMTKVAAKKTAGVLGDDLALNAEQVSGVRTERELPVVWAVAKGSMINKAILVPAALLITAVAPWAITPLLMIGGAYLCFEGFEKVSHKFLHPQKAAGEHAETLKALADPNLDPVAFEREKIKGAIRTDFILSAEIVVIALGTVQTASFPVQVAVIVGIAVLMTVGVYGLVAGIVKLDDVGFYLMRSTEDTALGGLQRMLGSLLVQIAPFLMKSLAYIGTAAMFIVGGGILLHGLPHAHEILHSLETTIQQMPGIGGILAAIMPTLLNLLTGILAGGLLLLAVNKAAPLWQQLRNHSNPA